MRDGDIFHWSWKDDTTGHLGSPYHCRSRIALVIDGKAYDTFWMHHGSTFIQGGWGPSIDRDSIVSARVNLSFIANLDDLREVPHCTTADYRREDVVDLRHSNNSSAPVYVRRGAALDAEVMRERVRYARETAEREIQSAQLTIERMREAERLIEAGDLDAVHI